MTKQNKTNKILILGTIFLLLFLVSCKKEKTIEEDPTNYTQLFNVCNSNLEKSYEINSQWNIIYKELNKTYTNLKANSTIKNIYNSTYSATTCVRLNAILETRLEECWFNETREDCRRDIENLEEDVDYYKDKLQDCKEDLDNEEKNLKSCREDIDYCKTNLENCEDG